MANILSVPFRGGSYWALWHVMMIISKKQGCTVFSVPWTVLIQDLSWQCLRFNSFLPQFSCEAKVLLWAQTQSRPRHAGLQPAHVEKQNLHFVQHWPCGGLERQIFTVVNALVWSFSRSFSTLTGWFRNGTAAFHPGVLAASSAHALTSFLESNPLTNLKLRQGNLMVVILNKHSFISKKHFWIYYHSYQVASLWFYRKWAPSYSVIREVCFEAGVEKRVV